MEELSYFIKEENYQERYTLFEFNDYCDKLYILISGEIELSRFEIKLINLAKFHFL
jgi:hypothetical protein